MFLLSIRHILSFLFILLFGGSTFAACLVNVETKTQTSIVNIEEASSIECKVVSDALAKKGQFPDLESAHVNGMASLYTFRQMKDLCTSQGGKLLNGLGCVCGNPDKGVGLTVQLDMYAVDGDFDGLSSDLEQGGCTGQAKAAAAGNGEPPECDPQVPNFADLRNAESNNCVSEEKSAEEMCDDTSKETHLGQQGDWSKSMAGIGQLGAAASCTEFAKTMGAVNAGLAAFKAACSKSISTCSQTCRSRQSEITAAIDQIKNKSDANGKSCTESKQYQALEASLAAVPQSITRCSSRQSAITAADQHMQVAANSQMQGTNCSNSLSTGAASLCANNPTFPGCQTQALSAGVDCATNPGARECVCKSNPSDPYCQGVAGKLNPNAGQSTNGSGVFGSASASSSDAGSSSEFGGGTAGFLGLDPSEISKGSGGLAGGGPSGGGGGGGGMLSAGQLGQARDRKGRTSGRPAIQYDLSTGGIRPKNPNGGAFGARPGDRNAVVIGPDGKIQKVDVNKWRPGMGARGLAGIVGEDGVHCETCGDIFKKINDRYKNLNSTLNP